MLSDRLYAANQELSRWQAAALGQLERAWSGQTPTIQQFLLEVSTLPVLDPAVVAVYCGEEALERVRIVEADGRFTVRTPVGLLLSETAQEFLLSQARRAWGRSAVQLGFRRAAFLYESMGRWGSAIHCFLAAGDEGEAARLWLEWRAVAGELAGTTVSDLAVPDEQRRRLDADAGSKAQKKREQAESQEDKLLRPLVSGSKILRWSVVGAACIGSLLLWVMQPFPGLTPAAMRMLATLLLAGAFWSTNMLPDYVVGLAAMTAWVVLGIVPPGVAVSGFTSETFFLIVGVLGIGASLQSSGLPFRIALYVLRAFPLSHRGQCFGLAVSGTVMAPAVPDVTSGVTMAGPVVQAVSDSLGYPRRSNASAGLAMAALLGFGQMSPFF